MWTLLPIQSPLCGVVMLTVGGVPLATVTVIGADVRVLGDDVSSRPRFDPSSLNCTPSTPTLSLAIAVTVTDAVTVAPFAGVVIDTVGGVVSGGGGLLTLTVTGADVVVLPAASRAVAVSVWLPFVVVVESQVLEYGEVVSSAPRFAPSSLNCTPATPTLSLAVALTATEPTIVAPPAGAVMETVGGVVSGGVPPPLHV